MRNVRLIDAGDAAEGFYGFGAEGGVAVAQLRNPEDGGLALVKVYRGLLRAVVVRFRRFQRRRNGDGQGRFRIAFTKDLVRLLPKSDRRVERDFRFAAIESAPAIGVITVGGFVIVHYLRQKILDVGIDVE